MKPAWILPSPIASKVARDSQAGILNTADCSVELLIMSIHLLLICKKKHIGGKCREDTELHHYLQTLRSP